MFNKILNMFYALINNLHMCTVIEDNNYQSLRKRR